MAEQASLWAEPPARTETGNVLIGTASWADTSLVKSGRFYPPEAKTPEARLRYYAAQFPVVEVDSTYYGLPAVDNAVRWAEWTPPGFVFDVKAFRAFTLHQTPLKALPADVREEAQGLANAKGNVYYPDLPRDITDSLWSRLTDGLRPLQEAGKLGYVLLQFPPWVMKRRSNLDHILECADRLSDHTVAVEFRNHTWLEDGDRRETLARLREENLALVIVDEPQGFTGSIPTVWEVTSPELSVVRFHGRNRELWNKRGLKSSADRFDYLYSEEELGEFLQPIQRLAREARRVHALFNNCQQDYAQQNARQLAFMLAA
jgi:uncharacterized protein YecE (DUF72 family)